MIPPKRLRDENLDIPGNAKIGIGAVAAALRYVGPPKNRKDREPQVAAQAAEPRKQESC